MCKVAIPRERDSGPIGRERRGSRLSRQSRKRNGSQSRLLLRTLLPEPTIDGQRSKCKKQDSKNARSNLQPRTTRVRAAIRFNGNYKLHRWLQLADESIPPPRQRLDKTRALRRVPQRFPNLVNRGIQIVIDIDKRVRPQPFLQLLPSHHIARTFQQNTQNLKGLPTKLQPNSALTQFSRTKVDFEISEPKEPNLGLCLCHR